jgi:plasmid replication initiation protein
LVFYFISFDDDWIKDKFYSPICDVSISIQYNDTQTGKKVEGREVPEKKNG